MIVCVHWGLTSPQGGLVGDHSLYSKETAVLMHGARMQYSTVGLYKYRYCIWFSIKYIVWQALGDDK